MEFAKVKITGAVGKVNGIKNNLVQLYFPCFGSLIVYKISEVEFISKGFREFWTYKEGRKVNFE